MAEEGRKQRYTPSVLVTPDQMEELSKAFETVGCRSELTCQRRLGSLSTTVFGMPLTLPVVVGPPPSNWLTYPFPDDVCNTPCLTGALIFRGHRCF